MVKQDLERQVEAYKSLQGGQCKLRALHAAPWEPAFLHSPCQTSQLTLLRRPSRHCLQTFAKLSSPVPSSSRKRWRTKAS